MILCVTNARLSAAQPAGKQLSKRSPLSSSQQTLVEENLAAYCEPWGTALPPAAAPRNRDSIASTDSDILPDRHTAAQVGDRDTTPAAARNRDSIASTDSDILPDRHTAAQVGDRDTTAASNRDSIASTDSDILLTGTLQHR
jgi:hypothetical protein